MDADSKGREPPAPADAVTPEQSRRADRRAGLMNGSVGFIARGFSQLALLAVTVVATRFLSTADFGAFAIASAFLFLMRNLLYVGPYEYLLKSPETPTLAGSCLVANLAISVLAALGFALLSLVSTPLFGTGDIGWLLLALMPSLLLAAGTSWNEAVMLRQQRVQRYYVFNVIGDSIGAAVALSCLVAGLELVALVAQVYARLATLLVLYLIDRRSVALPRAQRAEVRQVMGWSRSRYGAAFLNFGSVYGADIVLGILLSPAATGLYRAANRIVSALSDLFVQPLLKIAQTNVSARVARGQGPGKAWLGMFAAVAAFAWAALAALALTAHDIIPIILGPQWTAASPLVVIFCFARAFSVLDSVATPVLVASDQQRFMLRIQLAVASLTITGSAALAYVGPSAVATGVACLGASLSILYAQRALALSGAHSRDFLEAVVIALVPALAVAMAYLASDWAARALTGEPCPLALQILWMMVAGIIGLAVVRRPLLAAIATLGAPTAAR
jgi:O-antigen/teichoic acid export membrane protein